MMFLGLDCSSLAIHGALLDDKEQVVTLYKWGSSQKDFTNRFTEISVGYSEELSKIELIDVAAIEAAIFIQNPKTTIAIANVIGAAWAFLLARNIPTVIIDNRQWKKLIVGKGNASKEDIKNFAIDKWGEIFPEQDYADAACIALWNKRRFDNGWRT